MSFQTLCAGVAMRVGVQGQAPWLGSTDLTTAQIAAFVQEGLAQLAGEFDWQVLLKDASWTATGGVEQSLPLPSDCDRLLPDTVWQGNQNCKLRGPLSVAEWERLRRDEPNGTAWGCFTIADGALQVRGVTAGEVITARYRSSILTTSGGGAYANDGDTSLLNERLVGMAAEMLYRDAKGLPAGAASRYPVELNKARAKDRPIGVLGMERRRGSRNGDNNAVVTNDGALLVLS